MGGHNVPHRALVVAGVLVAGLSCKPAPATSAAPASSQTETPVATKVEPVEQAWVGSVHLPGMHLYVGVKLRRDTSGAWTGTIDIPQQFVAEGPLRDVTGEDGSLRFVLRPEGAPEAFAAVFAVEVEGDTATGTLTQGGAEYPVSLRRVDDPEAYAVGPRRPQQPHPPFPYASTEIDFTSKDGTKLVGTLTMPAGDGPHPGVVLMSGSGPQDRDEALADHKPFLVLADHLTRNGIAVLRYDDRGVPLSEGSYDDATITDFVDDGLAGLAKLREQPGVDPAATGIVGHSQGAVEAAIAGVESKDVAFVVMLAGFGLPGSELLVLQNRVILERSGVDDDGIEAQVQAQRALLDAVGRKAPDEEITERAAALVDLQIAASRSPGGVSADAREQMVKAAVHTMRARWFQSVLALDPGKWLRRLKRPPVLVVIGSKDTQVPVEQNMPAIEKALKRAGNPDVTLRTMDGLNHLFQHAETGTPQEYAQIEETMAPEVLELVTTWILEHR